MKYVLGSEICTGWGNMYRLLKYIFIGKYALGSEMYNVYYESCTEWQNMYWILLNVLNNNRYTEQKYMYL